MEKLKSFNDIEAAIEKKTFAINKSDNSAFLEAAKLNKIAFGNLKEELRVEEYSSFKSFIGRLRLFGIAHEENDCFYSYYIGNRNLNEAKKYLKKCGQILADQIRISNLPEKKFIDSEDFDATLLDWTRRNIEFDYFNYRLRESEFVAKIERQRDSDPFILLNIYHKCLNIQNEIINFCNLNYQFIHEDRKRISEVNLFLMTINYSNALVNSYKEFAALKDEYYAVAIVKNLVTALKMHANILQIHQDPKYAEGFVTLLSHLKKFLEQSKEFWPIIVQSNMMEAVVIENMKSIDPDLSRELLEKSFSTEEPKFMIVFLVHGFNTRGEWKNKLNTILCEDKDVKFIPMLFDYGTFVIQFILPWSRKKAINKFHDFYNDRLNRYNVLGPVACVGHSFGTFILSESIKRFPEVIFDKMILVGSIIDREYDWMFTHIKKPNLQIRFEIHKEDFAVKLAHVYSKLPWIKWLGDSGRNGFNRNYSFLTSKTYKSSDHSDMFGEEHMAKQWIPFLKDRGN